jgi:hypothetical protein
MGEQEIEEVDMRCVIGLLRRIHVCLRGMDQLYWINCTGQSSC